MTNLRGSARSPLSELRSDHESRLPAACVQARRLLNSLTCGVFPISDDVRSHMQQFEVAAARMEPRLQGSARVVQQDGSIGSVEHAVCQPESESRLPQ